MEVKEVYENYYSNIPLSTFQNICKGDPTSRFKENQLVKVGRYVKWLTKLYLSKNLLLEDIEKANQYLNVLYGVRNHIKGVDIFNFDSLTSGKTPLFEFVSKYIKPNNLNNESELLTNKYFIINKEAEVLFEDEKWLVVYPKTQDASGFYGANSQWCTRNPNSFHTYNDKGKLFIFILKDKVVNDIKNTHYHKLDTQRRFQYHIQENQFMNMSDNSNITDDVIELAFQILKNEIQTYYKQKITYDTFFKIIKQKYSEINFEDAYKIILFKSEHVFNSTIQSYLNRHSCDYNKFLQDFYHTEIDVRNKLIKNLANVNNILTIFKFDKEILLKYLMDFDYKESRLLSKLVEHKQIEFDDIIYIIETKKMSDENISDILLHFSDYMDINNVSQQNQLSETYLKLIKKYSHLNDEYLFTSLKYYLYSNGERYDNINGVRYDNLNEKILLTINTNLSFLRNSLKEMLYVNSFSHSIRKSLYFLMYRTYSPFRNEHNNEFNNINELLNNKYDTPVNQNDLICNYKLLLDSYFMTNESLYVHMLFTYSVLINKTEEDSNKIKDIIKTYYPEYFEIYQNMFIDLHHNLLNRYDPYVLSDILYRYDKLLHSLFKNRKKTTMRNNILDEGFFFMM